MLRNFNWVIEGRLAGMGMPSGVYGGRADDRDHAELRRDLETLKREGIIAVVSLTYRPLHRKTVERCGFKSLHLPVEDMTAPTEAQIRTFVEYVDRVSADGGVVVHCNAGMGRTGTMAACYLVWLGRTADEAMREVRERRPGSIETFEQEAAVAAFAERVRAASPEEG